MPKSTGLSDNSIGAIAYFTPFLPIFFLAIRRYNKRPYVRFHAWQSLLFNIFGIILFWLLFYALPFFRFLGLGILTAIPLLALVAAFLVWLWCVISAMRGKRFKLPIIGEWADEQAYR